MEGKAEEEVFDSEPEPSPEPEPEPEAEAEPEAAREGSRPVPQARPGLAGGGAAEMRQGRKLR